MSASATLAASPPWARLRTERADITAPSDPALPLHAFTVDVEDWYQSCIDYEASITERVVRNVDRILRVLSDSDTKATFFVQGKVAETFPALIASLVEMGHEVQSHGYSHRPLSSMNHAALRDELERAKGTVEDAAGTAVTAFRAQDFSILAGNLWALEALAETGFTVDSSIFPMRGPNYGIPGWSCAPHYVVVDGDVRILEVPVAIWSVGPARVPVAGGGYFRVLPRRVVARALRSIAASGRPAIVYCHPYEFNDTELAEYPDVRARTRVSQGIGRRSFTERVKVLLRESSFGRLTDVLRAWGIPCESRS